MDDFYTCAVMAYVATIGLMSIMVLALMIISGVV